MELELEDPHLVQEVEQDQVLRKVEIHLHQVVEQEVVQLILMEVKLQVQEVEQDQVLQQELEVQLLDKELVLALD